MADPDITCIKCKGKMEEGLILDRGHSDYLKPATWVKGPVEPSVWRGLKIKGLPQIPLRTFRCTVCGYLESYAK
jgi:hypothetical protein